MSLWLQNIQHAVHHLNSQRKRSMLTGLAICLAMLIVVFLLTFSENSKRTMLEDIKKISENSQLILHPRPTRMPGQKNTSPPTIDTIRPFLQAWQRDEPFSFSFEGHLKTQIGTSKAASSQVVFVDHQHFSTHPLTLESGRAFNVHDRSHSAFAIVGSQVAKQLTRQSTHTLFIENKAYQVIGTLAYQKPVGAQSDNNRSIFLLMPAHKSSQTPVERITFKLPQEQLAIEKVKLQKNLALTFPDVQWHMINTADYVEHLQSFFRKIQFTLWSICLICTLTAGINLSNSMYFSILERKKEIAIRLAIGAQPWHIRNMFLTETLVLCVISGIIGAVLAQLITCVVLYFTHMGFYWFWQPPLLGFALCLFVGFIAAYIPARSTASIQPIDILRDNA